MKKKLLFVIGLALILTGCGAAKGTPKAPESEPVIESVENEVSEPSEVEESTEQAPEESPEESTTEEDADAAIVAELGFNPKEYYMYEPIYMFELDEEIGFTVDGNKVTLPMSMADLEAIGYSYDAAESVYNDTLEPFMLTGMSWRSECGHTATRASVLNRSTDMINTVDGEIVMLQMEWCDTDTTSDHEVVTFDGFVLGETYEDWKNVFDYDPKRSTIDNESGPNYLTKEWVIDYESINGRVLATGSITYTISNNRLVSIVIYNYGK